MWMPDHQNACNAGESFDTDNLACNELILGDCEYPYCDVKEELLQKELQLSDRGMAVLMNADLTGKVGTNMTIMCPENRMLQMYPNCQNPLNFLTFQINISSITVIHHLQSLHLHAHLNQMM